MLTINDAAKKLNISERAIRRLVREKRIPVTMVGNRAYISEEWLDAKIEKEGVIDDTATNFQCRDRTDAAR